jgi:hypothetical protein
MVLEAKLTRLTHKIAIQLHLVAEGDIICSSRSMRPVLKLLDTPSYVHAGMWVGNNVIYKAIVIRNHGDKR